MRRLMNFLGVVLVLFVVGAAWVRLAPTDPAAWHVDPATATPPETPNFHLIQGADAPYFDKTPAALAAEVNRIALATPRTRVLAGNEGWVTYVTRSKWLGFPDYTSVRIMPDATGAKLAIFARARFGQSDFGVNKARAEAWLAALRR